MAKATSKSGMGSGWHFQSKRHSLARKTGSAGGKITYNKINVTVGAHKEQIEHKLSPSTSQKIAQDHLRENPNYYSDESKKARDKTYHQLKREGYKLKPNQDTDKDGVKNQEDCRPLNPKAQDNGEPSPTKEWKHEPSLIEKWKQQAKERAEAKRIAEDKKLDEELAKLKKEHEIAKEKNALEMEKAHKKAEIEAERKRIDEITGVAEKRRKRAELAKKVWDFAKKEIRGTTRAPRNTKKRHSKPKNPSTHTKRHHKRKDALFA